MRRVVPHSCFSLLSVYVVPVLIQFYVLFPLHRIFACLAFGGTKSAAQNSSVVREDRGNISRPTLNSSTDSSDMNRYHSSAPIKKQRTEDYSVQVKVEPRSVPSTFVASTLGRSTLAIKREHEEPSHDIQRRAPSENIHSVSVEREIHSESCNQKLHSVSSDTLHVVCFGPVLGQFRAFIHVLKQKFLEENSKLDACFCVGPFFHSDPNLETQAIEMINGGYDLPCPVYFTDEGILPNVVTKDELQVTFEWEPNLHFLSASDGVGDLVFLLDDRLSVAFTSPKFLFRPNSILERKCTDTTHKGCDLLITSEWGFGIHNILDISRYFPLNEGQEDFFGKIFEQERFDVTRVALMVKPQYHVTPSIASLQYCYFQTSPFSTGLNSSIFCNGFYSLSSFSGNPETSNEGKDKYSFIITYERDEETKGDGDNINPYRAFEMYLKQSTAPFYIGHNAIKTLESHIEIDEQSIQIAGEGSVGKVWRNKDQSEDTAKNFCPENLAENGSHTDIRDKTTPLDHSDTSSNCAGIDYGAQCDQITYKDPAEHNTSDRSPINVANTSIKDSTPPLAHKLINGVHYNLPLYEKPILHDKILQGHSEEAIYIIKCKKILKSIVKDENNRIISTSPRILEVESFDERYDLPIHSLLLNNNNLENRIDDQNRLKLLKYLLKEYPEGACTMQVTCDLPLSLACNPSLNLDSLGYCLSINDVDDKIIRKLTETYPTATKVMYEGKKSLIHILLEHRPSVELVKFIVEASESATHAEEDGGAVIQGSILEHFDAQKQLPLHTAIQYYASSDVIKYLIEKFPLGTREQMIWNYLPLHLAARWGCSESVIDALLESYPEAVVRKDSKRQTPLELILTHEEIWVPNFDIPDVPCDDERRSRIISRQTASRDEAQIPPRRLMPPFQMLKKMIEAYLKFENEQKCKNKKSSSKLKAILKAMAGKVRQKAAALRSILQSSNCCVKELDDAEAYLLYIKNNGVAPSPLQS